MAARRALDHLAVNHHPEMVGGRQLPVRHPAAKDFHVSGPQFDTANNVYNINPIIPDVKP